MGLVRIPLAGALVAALLSVAASAPPTERSPAGTPSPSKAAAPIAPAATAAPTARALAIPHDDASLAWGPCPDFIPAGCRIAVLHGDPAQPNADIYFQVPAGFRIPAHWHTSAERMVLVAGEMTVAYAGQPALSLHPGAYAYGPPKLSHEATCGPSADCVLFIAFEGPVDAFPTSTPGQ
jgi:quercetin dioxygenase-like cupin family protein